MDPAILVVLGIVAAKEIRQALQEGRQLSEEEITAMIISNGIKVEGVMATAKAEMEQYGVKVPGEG